MINSFKCLIQTKLIVSKLFPFQFTFKNMSSETNGRMLEKGFLKQVFDMVLKNTPDEVRDKKLINFKTPEELLKIIDFSLPRSGKENSELLKLCELTFEYSLNVNHPGFVNQLYAKPDLYGVAADVIATSLSTNLHTFEVAPVFVLAEKEILRKSLLLMGYENGEGAFCPGGSYANMLGLNLSKYYKFPQAKEAGLFGLPNVALFGSSQSHYSLKKNAVLLGFGTDCLITVECEENGRLMTSDLKKKIEKAKKDGLTPLFVNATAGTTVLGAFDNFKEISNICKENDIWMHVDAAYGGAVMFSETYKHLCDGIHEADSIAWNPHKMIGAPLQCSMFLTRHLNMMSNYQSFHVPYLFQQDKAYDTSYDVGTNLIQCGRRIDSFKLWMMWKARGDEGFGQRIDKAFDNAQYFTNSLSARDNFKLVIPNPEFTNVSFWFIPPSLQGKAEDTEYWEKLSKVAPIIKARMQKKGSLLIGYQPLGERVNFFRLVIINSDLCHDDMDFILNEIENCGKNL